MDAGVDAAMRDADVMDAGVMDASVMDANVMDAMETAVLPGDGESCTVELGCAGALECKQGICRDRCFDGSCVPKPLPATCPEASETRSACVQGACAEGLVCHVDGTCIEPGHCDEHGIATLAFEYRSDTEMVIGIDGTYAYTFDYVDASGGREYLRRSLSGGDDPPPVPANGKDIWSVNNKLTLTFVLDDGVAWFLGGDDIGADRYNLLTMPLDGSASPAMLGWTGDHLVIDSGHLYMSGWSNGPLAQMRLVRVPKAEVEDDASWETIADYASENRAVVGLARNGTELAVLFQHRTDSSSRLLRVYETSPTFVMKQEQAVGTEALPLGVSYVDGDHFVVGNDQALAWISRADGSVQSLSAGLNQVFALFDGYVYAGYCDWTPTARMRLARISLADGSQEEILPQTPGCAEVAVFNSDAGAFIRFGNRLLWVAR